MGVTGQGGLPAAFLPLIPAQPGRGGRGVRQLSVAHARPPAGEAALYHSAEAGPRSGPLTGRPRAARRELLPSPPTTE